MTLARCAVAESISKCEEAVLSILNAVLRLSVSGDPGTDPCYSDIDNFVIAYCATRTTKLHRSLKKAYLKEGLFLGILNKHASESKDLDA